MVAGKPIDVLGDVSPERYRARSRRSRRSRDGCDTGHESSDGPRQSRGRERGCRSATGRAERACATAWLGETAALPRVGSSRRTRSPTYETPDDAVTAFRSSFAPTAGTRSFCSRPPSACPGTDAPDREVARKLVAEVLAIGRPRSNEPEAKSVLQAYAIPTVDTRTARDPAEAARIAAEIGGRVAIKILSPTSCTNRTLAACASICPARRSRAQRARCSTRSEGGRLRRVYRLLHRRRLWNVATAAKPMRLEGQR